MIPNRVIQYYPATLAEAVEAYREATAGDLDVHYYSGGTEIMTHARDGRIHIDALIDLKGIPETYGINDAGEAIRFGACESLSAIAASTLFPLLSEAVRHIADRTVRNSITLGGNIAGRLPYREAVLPLLIAGAQAELFGPEGTRTVPLSDLFEKRLKTAEGEFLVALTVDSERTREAWSYRRRERDSRVDYPVVTVCMARVKGQLRMAISGAYAAPLRSNEADAAINRDQASPVRAEAAVTAIDGTIRDDIRASREYRRAMLVLSIQETIDAIEQQEKGFRV